MPSWKFMPYMEKIRVGIDRVMEMMVKMRITLFRLFDTHRCERVGHVGENAAVDVGHLDCLLVFRDDVVEQVLVLRILLEPRQRGQLLHDDFVRFEGCGEVDQCLAQFQQHEDLSVLHGVAQLQFELVAFAVDDAQVTQVHGGVAVQDLQDEPGLHVCVEAADGAFHERVQHGRVLHADGDDGGLGDDDATTGWSRTSRGRRVPPR